VEASGLHDLLYTGFSSVTHGMIHALCMIIWMILFV